MVCIGWQNCQLILYQYKEEIVLEYVDNSNGNNKKEENRKKRNIAIIVVLILLILGIAIIFLIRQSMGAGKPSFYLTSEEGSDSESIIVNIHVSDLPDNTFPAVSTSVHFDNDVLELTEVVNGNMEVYENGEDKPDQLVVPDWSYDLEYANTEGAANIMYLDMSGGSQAFNINGFNKDDQNIFASLKFHVKDTTDKSVKFTLEEATLATVDDLINDTGFSTAKGNLSVKNLSMKIDS